MLGAICREILIWLGVIPKPAYLARIVDMHPAPENIAPDWVYVVGGSDYQKWACFRCPTGSGEVIQLSLMHNRRPHWQVKVDWLGRPTIHLSVRQLESSFAHFWLRKGTISWCPDTGRKPHGNNLFI